MNNNKYDKLIVFFIAILAFGNVGGALQPVRIFIICCLPFMMLFFLKNKSILKQYRFEQFFFIVWWIYALFSLLWAIAPGESIKHIFYLAVNFLGFFVLIWLSANANKPQESIVKGWILMFLITLPVALYELWFDYHLPTSVHESHTQMNFGYDILERRFASVTFGNLNTYNTILCYIFPFIMFYILKSVSKKQMIFGSIVLLVLSYIILTNSSRGAIFCLLLGFILFFIYYIKSGGRLSYLFIVIVVAVFFAIRNYESLFGVIFNRLEVQGLDDQGRLDNIIYGWNVFLDSNLLGIGTANYIPVMETYGLSVTAPHNIFLEIGVQYGIFILVGFLILLWHVIKKGLLNPNKANKAFVLIAISIFPLAGVINSVYLLMAPIWIFLSSASIIANKNYNR